MPVRLDGKLRNMDNDSEQKRLEGIIGDHMMGALRRYLDDGIKPGDFLTAVLSNDLKEACGRADDHNRHILFEYVSYLYNYCPKTCWGSREVVQAYIEKVIRF